MKRMRCKDVGGPCEKIFEAETWDEMAEISRKHGMKMYQLGEENHVRKMQEMQNRMKDPSSMARWMKEKRESFEALPHM